MEGGYNESNDHFLVWKSENISKVNSPWFIKDAKCGGFKFVSNKEVHESTKDLDMNLIVLNLNIKFRFQLTTLI